MKKTLNQDRLQQIENKQMKRLQKLQAKQEQKRKKQREKKKNRKKIHSVTSLQESKLLILNEKTPFVVKETYRTARSNIIFSVSGDVEQGSKVIAFTSANPNEGKTTTSLNMAITFAQTGSKTIIIDGDLRKPRIHQYLNLEKNIGLSGALSGEYTIDDVIQRDVRENLDFIASGAIPPNPAELLASSAMKNVIENLSKRYDYIIIDTPPVNVVTDATTLSSLVNGYVLVVRLFVTPHESITQAINLLNIANSKILGFFANDVSLSSKGYGLYKRRYGYKYGYKYNYQDDYNYAYEDEEDPAEQPSKKPRAIFKPRPAGPAVNTPKPTPAPQAQKAPDTQETSDTQKTPDDKKD